MCGIFALLFNDYYSTSFKLKVPIIEREFMKGKSRGPEFSKLEYHGGFEPESIKRGVPTSIQETFYFGFHRLAINGLNEASNQPMKFRDVMLICNGEIYNYKELYDAMKITPHTQSDCEVIIHLYLQFGMEQTLRMLDGVFAFALYDERSKTMYVARDPLGVRPLYSMSNEKDELYGFSSELKTMEYFYNMDQHSTMMQFPPGTFSTYQFNKHDPFNRNGPEPGWEQKENKPYFLLNMSHTVKPKSKDDFFYRLSQVVSDVVIKRCKTTEREVACLLSGGLDSSLIAAIVANYFRSTGKTIETYSIGLANSEDIKYARIVADYIGSNHTEVIVTEEEMFEAIPEVIYALESYDTTTVRASLGNYLIGKYISKHSNSKVIFNGDGSDELFGGYLYMHKCPDDAEFDKETRRLLKDIHLFDVLRSDKSISSNGLEPRTPFLDKNLVNYVLSLSPAIRNHRNEKQCEKYLLRKAFTKEYCMDNLHRPMLPDEILWRRKEAFSDGVSSQGRSLFKLLQDKIAAVSNTESNIQSEKKYYKELFDQFYPNCENIVPYFWMPKYVDAEDPSARTLPIY